MDAVNFAILAPRFGSHPMMSSWSGIGNSGMNGGAFNWGGLWSGVKSFGNHVKSWGSKAWNSQTGKLLRQRLNDTKVREKFVEGINTGVHGALDIANQEIAKQIEKRLERHRPLEEEIVEEVQETKDAPESVIVELPPKKRTRDEELIVTTDAPPSYEEAIGAPIPTTRPIPELARPVIRVEKPAPNPFPVDSVLKSVPAAMPVMLPARRGWQGTLANIVGVGLQGVKRRRCF